jgi:hypothetical protein
MAKHLCECGHVISDSTDDIPYKARFIADQDVDYLFDTMEKNPDAILLNFGDIFQCPDCNNLMIFSADYKRRCDFQPINKDASANITISQVEGKKVR